MPYGDAHLAQAHQDAGNLRFIAGQVVGIDALPDQPDRLAGVQLVDSDGQTQTLPADALLVQLGISPKLAFDVEKRPFYVTEDGLGKPVPGLLA